MPYYGAGDYYRGDYYRGDFLGIGKALKKLNPLKLLAGVAGKVVGSIPIVGPLASQLIPTYRQPMVMTGGGGVAVPEPGVTGAVHRIVPGGHTGYGHLKKDGEWTDRARARMQVTNTRALKRAGRRVRGFLKVAHQLGALPVNRGKGKQLFKRKRAR